MEEMVRDALILLPIVSDSTRKLAYLLRREGLKVFSTALGGWWASYALTGFLTVFLLVGSFFIKRFWCLMCPMGYLLGIFYKFNLFKLKKDCTACTECGACYEACPMRLKNIYTSGTRPMFRPWTASCAASASTNARRTTLCG